MTGRPGFCGAEGGMSCLVKKEEISKEGRSSSREERRDRFMALNIKNPETERLARELARRRKQGITEVLTDVLRKEVERERKKPSRQDFGVFKRGIDEIVAHFNSLPVLDDRTDDEILGYNEQGLFD
jgi:antitoxin VapB